MSQVRASQPTSHATRTTSAQLMGAIQESEIPRDSRSGSSRGTSAEEQHLIERLRNGDEAAFARLVEQYHGALLRLAMAHVSDRSVAEEVVQETWLGVLEGLNRFEERCSLKTWVFRILTNKAKTRGVRESRHTTFSDVGACEEDPEEPAVDPSRFQRSGFWVDHWAVAPHNWDEETPEKLLLSKEGVTFLEQAIEGLPPRLRQVLVMRDVEGVSSKEVCSLLEISEANQRVLLHRSRSKVRRALEQYLQEGVRPA
ncbi:MAG: RNA polymerase sigma factor [Candidatus Methylomirabilis sp.]